MGGERDKREREKKRERERKKKREREREGEFFNTISLRGNVDATFVGRV